MNQGENVVEETEVSGHKDESAPTEEAGKVVTETPASMEPVSCTHGATPVHCASSGSADQASRPLIDYGELRSRVSMTDVLTRIGYQFNIAAGQHRGKCPLHDPSIGRGKPFSVNFKRDMFRCFESSCAAQGNVLDFWSAYSVLPLYEAALDLAKTFGIELPVKTPISEKRSTKKEKKSSGHTPPAT